MEHEMSTTVPLSTSRLPAGRGRLLGVAGAALAAGSVAVALAVSAGGAGSDARPVSIGEPATAQPDPAKLYHRALGPQQPATSGSVSALRAAERFHHRR
jgi:hypothetical protein